MSTSSETPQGSGILKEEGPEGLLVPESQIVGDYKYTVFPQYEQSSSTYEHTVIVTECTLATKISNWVKWKRDVSPNCHPDLRCHCCSIPPRKGRKSQLFLQV